MKNSVLKYDVLVIGSGAAGLGVALSVTQNARVAIVSKEELASGASLHAQGGIAAVMDADPHSLAAHIQDTLQVGAGLCHPDVVEYTVRQAKSAVEWLIERGVQFTQEASGEYHLTREGGHTRRRILHAEDRTGAVVIKTLAEQVKAHPHIDCFTTSVAIDLRMQNNRCVGADFYNKQTQALFTIAAKQVVLATGGASYLYSHTTSSNRTTGDGIAMAWRAGCRVANLEFNQFHPTALYHPLASAFLISEVVRGEGGHLLLPNGTRFMPNYDVRGELASRDIVARAIDTELKKNQLPCVYLDISHRSSDFIQKTFPTIYEKCLSLGLDMTREPLPVVPAAHYTCGGVMTNLQGETDVPHLYAVGEVAHTGLHGANRMASNSLLECLVFAASSAQAIKRNLQSSAETGLDIAPIDASAPLPSAEEEEAAMALTQEIRALLWDKVGIVRHSQGLGEARDQLREALSRIPDRPRSLASIELRHLACVAYLTAQSASARQESRGLHYHTDYLQTEAVERDTILSPESLTSRTS